MPKYFKDRAERQAAEAAYRSAYAEQVAVLESLGYKPTARKRGGGLPRRLSTAALAAFMEKHRAAEEWLARQDAMAAAHVEETESSQTIH